MRSRNANRRPPSPPPRGRSIRRPATGSVRDEVLPCPKDHEDRLSDMNLHWVRCEHPSGLSGFDLDAPVCGRLDQLHPPHRRRAADVWRGRLAPPAQLHTQLNRALNRPGFPGGSIP